ncbi:MAG: hypothetical protein ACK5YR_12810 [Pirellula sp.]|jgi:hypothetical protein
MPNKGTKRRFPAHRQTVLDILAASKSVPAFPLLRDFQLGATEAARKACPTRIGWTAIFLKAYSLVSMEIPELRDRYVRYPREHIYRHPSTVASISIHRNDDQGNPRLIWAKICNAETTELQALQGQLNDALSKPLSEIYRDGCILERSPKILRRICWWWAMNCAGRKHCKHIGTYSISSLASQNCLNAYHPLITTTSLAYAPVSEKGLSPIALICDHRALDGMLASQALQSLESKLQNEIVTELESISFMRTNVA